MSGKLVSDQLVRIGYLRKPHGLHGFLKMTCLTDFASERFQAGSECILVREEHEPISAIVEECKPQGAELLIRFKGMCSKEDAIELRNTYLCVQLGDRMLLEENDFYVDQLVGLEVYTASSICLGRISKVDELPANPVLEISATDAGSIMVPFVKALVSMVDLKQGKVILSEEFSTRTIG